MGNRRHRKSSAYAGYAIAIFCLTTGVFGAGCNSYPVADGSNPLGVNLRDIESGCIKFASCHSLERISNCVTGNRGMMALEKWGVARLSGYGVLPAAVPASFACIASADSCDEVHKCLAHNEIVKDCSLGNVSCLDGATIGACVSKNDQQRYLVSFNCGLLGLHCVTGPGGQVCGETVSTVEGKVLVSCDGTQALVDSEGTHIGVDCALWGETCMSGEYEIADHYSVCKGSGGPCDAGPKSCVSNKLIGCSSGFESVLDCEKSGLVCRTTEDMLSSCFPVDCDPSFFKEECLGTKVRYCSSEGIIEKDCTDFGFSSCMEEEQRAICVF